MRTSRTLLALTLPFLFLIDGGAQAPATVDPALLGPLRWRSIGPANTG
jgi:hypothetical protein